VDGHRLLHPLRGSAAVAGRLADLFGRRRLLLAGTVSFAGGSIIAAASPDVQVLIAGIALSGIGGAMLMPASMARPTRPTLGRHSPLGGAPSALGHSGYG
jgi:MFS family permease